MVYAYFRLPFPIHAVRLMGCEPDLHFAFVNIDEDDLVDR